MWSPPDAACDQIVILAALTHGPQHDHAIAQCQLGVGNTTTIIGNDQIRREAEGGAEPLDSRRGVVIAHPRDDAGIPSAVRHGKQGPQPVLQDIMCPHLNSDREMLRLPLQAIEASFCVRQAGETVR